MKVDTSLYSYGQNTQGASASAAPQSAFQDVYANTRDAYQEHLEEDILGSAPDAVRDAWKRAEAKTGESGYTRGHITQAMVDILTENRRRQMLGLEIKQGDFNLFGSTVQSAIAKANEYLFNLGKPENNTASRDGERRFYRAFLEELQNVKL